jgi:opacity protein-like surface antigen
MRAEKNHFEKKDFHMLKYFLPIALAVAGVSNASYFYIGGGVGVTDFDTVLEHRIWTPTATNPLTTHELDQMGHVNFVGGGFVGYNWDLSHCFDLCVEAFGNGYTSVSKIRHEMSAAVTSPNMLESKQSYSFGARVLPGYRFSCKAEGHLIGGYTFGGFKFTDNGVYGLASKSYHSNGYQVGAGTTVEVYPSLCLRLDTVYNGYQHRNVRGAAPSTAQGGPAGAVYTTYKLRNSSVDSTVSILYGF